MQPDTITPGGPQGLNRYSYVANNPINFSDPTGHLATDDNNDAGCEDTHQCKKNYLHRRSRELVKSLMGKEDRDDLEAMTDIIDLGASLFKTNAELIPTLSSFWCKSGTTAH